MGHVGFFFWDDNLCVYGVCYLIYDIERLNNEY